MPETPDLTHVILKQLQASSARIEGKLDDVLSRLSDVESALVGVGAAVNHGAAVDARQQVSLDRIVKRIERIERRLELTDPEVSDG